MYFIEAAAATGLSRSKNNSGMQALTRYGVPVCRSHHNRFASWPQPPACQTETAVKPQTAISHDSETDRYIIGMIACQTCNETTESHWHRDSVAQVFGDINQQTASQYDYVVYLSTNQVGFCLKNSCHKLATLVQATCRFLLPLSSESS